MKKLAIFVVVTLMIPVIYFAYSKSKTAGKKIGIVLPVQHIALDDIASGFRQELLALLPNETIHIEVQNALGDINLQKSIINKFLNNTVDLLVPIGKGASLMAMNLAPEKQRILFLAAFITKESTEAQSRPELMGMIDEIPVELQLKLMTQVIPNLKKMAVVYVSSDKIFDDVKLLSEKAKGFGINVQQLMVQQISELYTVASRIERDNQAIFILKDVLVASGINALVQQAQELHIPLITSDEGTVQKGGAFALGVKESDIGRQGGKIAAQFLQGKKPEQPIQFLNEISVFVNKAACDAQGISLKSIEDAAALMSYKVIGG